MKAVFTFGRFNPPTVGHGKLIEKVKSIAGGSDFFIYPSWSKSPDKDPMPHELKAKYMKLAFPEYAKTIISNPKCKTAIHILTKLYDAGYDEIVMVVGSDRIAEFSKLLNRYNGKKSTHGFYEFPKDIKVVSAGERDPDAQGVEGMSASKMRQAVKDDDFDSFEKGIPEAMPNGKKLQMFKDLKKHMGLKEYYEEGTPKFREYIQRLTPQEKVVDYVKERTLSSSEKKKKEEIVMKLKKKSAYFKEKHGDRWKEVMYATATKMAKNEQKEIPMLSFKDYLSNAMTLAEKFTNKEYVIDQLSNSMENYDETSFAMHMKRETGIDQSVFRAIYKSWKKLSGQVKNQNAYGWDKWLDQFSRLLPFGWDGADGLK